jgi:uncharacterized cupredoxin-like copper-binding protein
MKIHAFAAVLALALASPAAATGMHGAGHTAFGAPAPAAEATRTVAVTLSDDMAIRMDLDAIKVGEVIRFVVTNAGAQAHEFSVGDTASQRAHAAMMKKMPGMTHDDDPAALTLQPGETKELTWRFDVPVKGKVVFACQMPGHYDGGMVRAVPLTP